MSLACQVENLTKVYKSGFRLGPINFALPPGRIAGLIGENGAGKTTFIRLILGLLRKNSGQVTIFGLNADSALAQVKQKIGYVDEEPIFYEWMKVSWLEHFLSPYYDGWNSRQFHNLLERFQINPKQRVGELSKGNKVKLAIAVALSHRPELVIMDEPTSGLDPLVRHTILDTLKDYITSNYPASLLFSSHITSDLEKICDRVAILHEGRLVLDESVEYLKLSRYKHQNTLLGGPTLEEIFLESVRNFPHDPDHCQRLH